MIIKKIIFISMDPLLDQQSLYDSFELSEIFDVKIHRNGIVLLFLRDDSGVSGVTFAPVLLESLASISGRGKHGAVTQMENTDFAELLDANGETRKVRSPLRVKALEVNTEARAGALMVVYMPKWE